MKYTVEQAYIILDDDNNVVDWYNEKEDAEAVAEEMEQDDEDRRFIEKAFGAVDN